MKIFAICICTHKRPKMLTRCLFSLAKQNSLPDWEFIFIIVDNELTPNNRHIVEEFERITNFMVKYIHQPRRGIAVARNAALEEALKQKVDWICYFDDDQYADKNAIVTAYQTAQESQAEIVFMRVLYTASNKILQASIQRADGLLIKADSLASPVNEEVVPEREKFWFKCYKTYYQAVDHYKRSLKKQYTFSRLFWKITRKLMSIIEMICLPVYLITCPPFFYKRIHKIAGHFFEGCGYIAGILKLNSRSIIGGSGGCLFNSLLVKPDGLALRFNEETGLGGYEDTMFFSLAISLGGNTAIAERAIVYEEVVPEREKLWFKCYKSYCRGADYYKWSLKQRYMLLRLLKIMQKLISIIEVPVLLVYLVLDPPFFYKRLHKIASRFSMGCGYIAGLLKLNSQYYKNTKGY